LLHWLAGDDDFEVLAEALDARKGKSGCRPLELLNISPPDPQSLDRILRSEACSGLINLELNDDEHYWSMPQGCVALVRDWLISKAGKSPLQVLDLMESEEEGEDWRGLLVALAAHAPGMVTLHLSNEMGSLGAEGLASLVRMEQLEELTVELKEPEETWEAMRSAVLEGHT
jgi:hypothetical protein